jgi:hypothetical protein
LQKHWARENGVNVDYEQPDGPAAILMAQISALKPDVILFCWGGFHTMPPEVRRQIKTRFPFVKAVVALWSDVLPPGDSFSMFGDLDMVFGGDDGWVADLRSAGIPAHLVYACFDDVYCGLDGTGNGVGPAHDFIFAGSSGYGQENHRDRYLDIIDLMNQTDIQLWCLEKGQLKWPPSVRRRVKDNLLRMLCQVNVGVLQHAQTYVDAVRDGGSMSRLIDEAIRVHEGMPPSWIPPWWHDNQPVRDMFPDRCSPPVFGLEYFKLLKSARIVFNRHIDAAGHGGNFRMFEATGVGACLLTDRGKESADLFVPDEEIVTYSSLEECIEKANYLMENESERQQIAMKGKARTLKDHTVMRRAEEIDAVLRGSH